MTQRPFPSAASNRLQRPSTTHFAHASPIPSGIDDLTIISSDSLPRLFDPCCPCAETRNITTRITY
jgi:hypothetical protein